ncbi:hypothetical protein TNCT_629521 [Trichonephila clavata]|uniref:Uncharacterized protein n=1 Tax=Trichonephila clavata TaxID=2740835 RepID=A0A8X6FB38_TRICU|nr:hypothetical protein TNCT_629521 [Trichonephila clavata]
MSLIEIQRSELPYSSPETQTQSIGADGRNPEQSRQVVWSLCVSEQRFSHIKGLHKDSRRQRDLIAGRGMSSAWNFIYRRK